MERIHIVDRIYEDPDLPEDILAIKNESYRTAFLSGATLIGGNALWERFFIADRLIAMTFSDHNDEIAESAETLSREIAERERELAAVGAEIAALGDALARRAEEIEQVRASRRSGGN
jgi:septal ring factor EnvC (AmiA/AmiB activator)